MLKKRNVIAVGFFAAVLLLVGMICFLSTRDGDTRVVKNLNWSMQGEWIVFSCAPRTETQSSLYLVRPDGSELTRLTTDDIGAVSPAWSPDGEEIAFIGIIDGKENIYKLKRGDNKPVAITKLDARTWVGDIAWSPDGQWIVFSSYVERLGDQLFKIRVDTSEMQQLTEMHCALVVPTGSKCPEANS
jgi:Tol biopolymer transport system component